MKLEMNYVHDCEMSINSLSPSATKKLLHQVLKRLPPNKDHRYRNLQLTKYCTMAVVFWNLLGIFEGLVGDSIQNNFKSRTQDLIKDFLMFWNTGIFEKTRGKTKVGNSS